MITPKDVERILEMYLDTVMTHDADLPVIDWDGNPLPEVEIVNVRTFADWGMQTHNTGVIIRTGAGQEFRISIHEARF